MAKKKGITKGIKKTRSEQYKKHLYISSIIVILCAIVVGVVLYIQSYQDKVYYADRAKYDVEKTQCDSIQTIDGQEFNYIINDDNGIIILLFSGIGVIFGLIYFSYYAVLFIKERNAKDLNWYWHY